MGNFSIETSYRSMHGAWPEGEPQPDRHTVSLFTTGLVDRLRIWREVGRLQHDLLHITGDIHFAAIGRRRPTVLTVHDLGMLDEGPAWKRRLKKWFWLTWPLRSCDRLIAVSEATKADLLRRTDFPADRIEVIPSVISPAYTRRDTPPEGDIPVILHIGLADNKNLDGHAKALEGMQAHLRIIGEPSAAQQDMLRRRGVDFSWASRLSETELQREYAAADLLLFCSTLEGYGMPIIEAQTVGVPVVTSDRHPMRDTAGGAAELANPDDADHIRKAVQRVLDDPQRRQDLIGARPPQRRRLLGTASAAAHAAELYGRILAGL